jgi:XTP/dITP diphosphohydrolase
MPSSVARDPVVLVLATRNSKKRDEMAELLAPPWEPNPRLRHLVIETLERYPDVPDIDEDADTFGGNARKKAVETACAVGRWVVADDSGLTVDALGGAPGVLSARFSGRHGNDLENNRVLLERLANVPDEKRGAAFVCALALVDPRGDVRFETEAFCRGRIIHAPRGNAGFGYDPLFLIREYNKTFAELGTVVKHQLSHRARAFAKLRPALERLLNDGAIGS